MAQYHILSIRCGEKVYWGVEGSLKKALMVKELLEKNHKIEGGFIAADPKGEKKIRVNSIKELMDAWLSYRCCDWGKYLMGALESWEALTAPSTDHDLKDAHPFELIIEAAYEAAYCKYHDC